MLSTILGSDAGHRYAPADRLSIETPRKTPPAPAYRRYNIDSSLLHISPKPVFSVMVINLQRHREISVQGKIRRHNIAKLLQHRNISINIRPQTNKTVIIKKKVQSLVIPFTTSASIAERNPFTSIVNRRTDLWNTIQSYSDGLCRIRTCDKPVMSRTL